MSKDSPSPVGEDYKDTYFFQQAKDAQLETFEAEKAFSKTESMPIHLE
jgi:hypothetical protein